MRKRCGATELHWEEERHALAPVVGRPGWWSCARCGLEADVAHRTAAEAAKCPVRRGTRRGAEDPEATKWYRRWVGLSGLWIRAAYGTPTGTAAVGGIGVEVVEGRAAGEGAPGAEVIQVAAPPAGGREDQAVEVGRPPPEPVGAPKRFRWDQLRWIAHLPVRIPGWRCASDAGRPHQGPRRQPEGEASLVMGSVLWRSSRVALGLPSASCLRIGSVR